MYSSDSKQNNWELSKYFQNMNWDLRQLFSNSRWVRINWIIKKYARLKFVSKVFIKKIISEFITNLLIDLDAYISQA